MICNVQSSIKKSGRFSYPLRASQITIAGVILLIIAAVLLVVGNKMLTALDACSLLRVCTPNMNPNSSSFASTVARAQIEVALGVAFILAGVPTLILGLNMRRKKTMHDEGKEKDLQDRPVIDQ
jgi:hypothetical protein